jgi:hypothetical protein
LKKRPSPITFSAGSAPAVSCKSEGEKEEVMMSAADKVIPLLSMPWLTCGGLRLSTTPLPGLRPEVIQSLEPLYPGVITPETYRLLRTSCGLEGTALGPVDFTGRWHPEEPLSVFRPCLTLCVDNEGRRWIAETSNRIGLPGPVWCVWPEPEVALFIAHDLSDFLATLHDRARANGTLGWLRSLSAEARSIWARRHSLAIRPSARRWDKQIRGWLATLPFDARVFDLRSPVTLKGWPYGLAGSSGHLYRCGKLPIFAVAESLRSGGIAEAVTHVVWNSRLQQLEESPDIHRN